MIINFGIARPDKIGTHTTQVAYALFIFVVALWLYARYPINNNCVVRFFAKISYSLYLIHLPFGYAITSLVYPRLGLTTALLISFFAVVALSAAIYFIVEKPALKAGRGLLSVFPLAKPAIQ